MTKPIRILHAVSKMDREGIETFIMNVYRNIDRKKVQFDFLDHNKETGAFDSEINTLGGKIFKLNKLSGKYFLRYEHDLKHFFTAHREYKIIHSHLNLLSTFTLKTAKKMQVPVRIAHSHSSLFLNTGLKKMIKLYAKSQMNKYATDKFACSEKAGIWQFGKSEYDAGNVKIISNGIDIDKFRFSTKKQNELKNKLGIKSNEIIFGHSGAFRKVKNHKFLLEVFFEIKQKLNNSKLILVGDGNLRQSIKDHAEKLGILNDCIFTGSVENVNDYLSVMDCFIFPSIYEGLGISIIEAQVSGLLCFVSDTIPNEAKISDKYFSLPLTTSAENWADTILSKIELIKNNNRSLPKESEKYNIKSISKMLEDFYCSFYY